MYFIMSYTFTQEEIENAIDIVEEFHSSNEFMNPLELICHITSKTGYTRRQVQDLLDKLKNRGIIAIS